MVKHIGKGLSSMFKVANCVYVKSEQAFQYAICIMKIKVVFGQILLALKLIPFHTGYFSYKKYSCQIVFVATKSHFSESTMFIRFAFPQA